MPTEQKEQYTSEDMKRYFNDPEYRKQKRGGKTVRWMSKRLQRYLIIGTLLLTMIITYGAYLFSGLPSLERIENPKDARSYLYRISFDFLKHLGLTKVEDLPQFAEYRKERMGGLEEPEENAK